MTFREQLRQPILSEVYDLWLLKHAGARLPSRRDFDPIELKSALGFINLVDVLPEPPHFRYRLVGSALAQLHGRDRTGQFVGSNEAHSHDALANYLLRLYSLCRDMASAIYSESVATYRDLPPLAMQRLFLPLATDGKSVDVIIGLMALRDPSLKLLAPFREQDLLALEETSLYCAKGDARFRSPILSAPVLGLAETAHKAAVAGAAPFPAVVQEKSPAE